MNYLAARAEVAVRKNRFRIEPEKREFVDIVVNNFFNKLEERTKKQIEDSKRMMLMVVLKKEFQC